MPYDPTETIIMLTPRERLRLAAWLTDYDRPPDFNLGRYRLLQQAGSDYISAREMGLLMDEMYPIGSAVDVIRGTMIINVSEADNAPA